MKSSSILVFSLLALVTIAAATRGTVTYYDPPYRQVTDCYDTFQGNLTAAVPDAMWDDGAACGRRFAIRCTGSTNTCTGNTVVVKVVDLCPEYPTGPDTCNITFDITRDAFLTITNNLDVDKIKIEYHQV